MRKALVIDQFGWSSRPHFVVSRHPANAVGRPIRPLPRRYQIEYQTWFDLDPNEPPQASFERAVAFALDQAKRHGYAVWYSPATWIAGNVDSIILGKALAFENQGFEFAADPL